MRSNPNTILGIIYGEKQKDMLLSIYNNILKNNNSYEQLQIACLKVNSINFDQMVTDAIIITCNGMSEMQIRIPGIIFNFTIHTKSNNIKAMRKLRTCNDIKVINPVNRFNQAVLYQIIESFPQSEQFLLPFSRLTEPTIGKFLSDNISLYILPETGLSSQKAVHVYRAKNKDAIIRTSSYQISCKPDEVLSTLHNMNINRNCIILKETDIILWNNRPVEVRVYMHKNEKGVWSILGSLAKTDIFPACYNINELSEKLSSEILPSGELASEELPLEILPSGELANVLPRLISKNSVDDIKRKILNNAIIVCCYLEYYVADMGSLCFDYVIDYSGNPFLINIGGFEQSYGIDRCSDKLKKDCCENAIKYMLYLHNSEPED